MFQMSNLGMCCLNDYYIPNVFAGILESACLSVYLCVRMSVCLCMYKILHVVILCRKLLPVLLQFY